MTSRAERRSTTRALPFLAAVFAVFFLPVMRGCGSSVLPVHVVTVGVGCFLWIAPCFLVAGILALATLRALRQGEPTRGTRLLALGSVAVLWLATLGTLPYTIPFAGGWPAALVSAFVLPLPVVLVRRARGRTPWAIWERLLAAYTLTAVVSGPTAVLSAELITHPDGLQYGAYIHFAALGCLLVVTVGAVLRRRRGRTSG